jgi:hypothetical protein
VENMFSWEGVARQLGDLYTKLMTETSTIAPTKKKVASA